MKIPYRLQFGLQGLLGHLDGFIFSQTLSESLVWVVRLK